MCTVMCTDVYYNLGKSIYRHEDMEGFIREQDIVTLGVTVWHVLEYEHYKIPETSYGQFHDGDTYVVRWQYMITSKGQGERDRDLHLLFIKIFIYIVNTNKP